MAQPSTRVLTVTSINPPNVDSSSNLLNWWNANKDNLPQDQVNHLEEAAHALQTSTIPVAFPTETVYGLGADATRSEAVRGIYAAKQRPSDNPLIVHIGSLDQLRSLLSPGSTGSCDRDVNGTTDDPDPDDDPIPAIYQPLIDHFWPGPLTLLFPLPSRSPFAKEVTSSNPTVGIRIPSSPLARLLISLCNRPLAAPSANASTRPSPTTAAHVLHDLDGRIDLILDGGGCEVGVESTVVDGLCSPPSVLRPGGVGIEQIRRLGGVWADVEVGYRDRGLGSGCGEGDWDGVKTTTENDGQAIYDHVRGPRAPGMKYRHYAPHAQVHLFEDNGNSTSSATSVEQGRAKLLSYCDNSSSSSSSSNRNNSNSNSNNRHRHHNENDDDRDNNKSATLRIGIITTKTWPPGLGFPTSSSFSASTKQIKSPSSQPTHPQTPSSSIRDHSLKVSTHHIPAVLDTPSPPPPPPPPPPPHTPAGTNTGTTTTIQTKEDKDEKPRSTSTEIYSINLGGDAEGVARGLFSALRELDDVLGCAVILIEGIGMEEAENQDQDQAATGIGTGGKGKEGRMMMKEKESDSSSALAAAVMNRLRKAAE